MNKDDTAKLIALVIVGSVAKALFGRPKPMPGYEKGYFGPGGPVRDDEVTQRIMPWSREEDI